MAQQGLGPGQRRHAGGDPGWFRGGGRRRCHRRAGDFYVSRPRSPGASLLGDRSSAADDVDARRPRRHGWRRGRCRLDEVPPPHA